MIPAEGLKFRILPPEVELVSARGSRHTLSTVYNPLTHTIVWDFKDPLPAGTSGELALTVKFPPGATGDGVITTNTADVNIDNGPNGKPFHQ